MGFWERTWENAKLAGSNTNIGDKVVKATRAGIEKINNDLKKISEERVEETFKRVQEMIEISEVIRNDSRLLGFQNYTRYYVSVKFLRDMVSQREEIKSPTDINFDFLNLIKKFLTDSISDQELLELDEQIQQL